MADFASEGGHFYTVTGEPAYEVPRADGKGMRPTTLRDARKLSLLPSFTTIVKAAGTPPGLMAYFEEQAYQSAFTTPAIAGETYDAWKSRVKDFAREHSINARDTGTLIHGAIERVDDGGEWEPWVRAAFDALPDITWASEKSFVHLELRYGCKLDLHATSFSYIFDVKTKDGPANGRKLWDEELMQLAAQRLATGHPEAECGILHIDRNEPTAEVLMASEQELARGLAMFKAYVALYYAKTGL